MYGEGVPSLGLTGVSWPSHEIFMEVKFPPFLGTAEEGLADTAVNCNVSFSQAVEAELMIITE